MAFVLTVVVAVGVTVFVMRDSGGSGSTGGSNAKGDIASANDTGPVSVITSDPTCEGWRALQNVLSAAETNGWDKRDPSLSSSAWTPSQRAQYEAVGNAMRSTADRAVALAKQTPHRVMRELYEQFISYGRAYADAVASYVASNDFLAQTNVGLSSSISGVCDAIQYGDVGARASLVKPDQPPTVAPKPGDVANPTKFVQSPPPACDEWVTMDSAFQSSLTDWSNLDPSTPATQWPPEYRITQVKAADTMDRYADSMEKVGRRSQNSTFEDFAALAANYLRTYTAASPTYTVKDNYIVTPGLRINNLITAACQAAAG